MDWACTTVRNAFFRQRFVFFSILILGTEKRGEITLFFRAIILPGSSATVSLKRDLGR
jgi:hypothetical protein